MERGLFKRASSQIGLCLALVLFSLIVTVVADGNRAYGAILGNRSLTLSNNQTSSTSFYSFEFDITTPGILGSIEFQFCSNSPVASIPCVAPPGFNATGASLGIQSGETGFNISPLTTANNLILSRNPAPDSAIHVRYIPGSITNPSTEGSYYVRIRTFPTNDASGPETDFGGLAYSINGNLQISAEVPPYIIFCAAVTIPAYSCSGAQGNLVDLGQLSPKTTSSGQSQILVATNAQNGYTLYDQGTTLTSGNNVINSLSSPSAVFLGANQFGINLRANLSPAVGQDPAGPGLGVPATDYNQPDRYKFVSGDTLAGFSSFEDFRRYTVSYVADVSGNQQPGTYVSTITYVCVGNF